MPLAVSAIRCFRCGTQWRGHRQPTVVHVTRTQPRTPAPHQSHMVPIKEPEAPKAIYQLGHTHMGATVLAITLLERAATAATITASGWQGQRPLARQTSNQRHSETLLGREAKIGKPWNLKDTSGRPGIRRAGIPQCRLPEVKDFCSHRRLYLKLNTQAFQADYHIAIFPPKLWQWK